MEIQVHRRQGVVAVTDQGNGFKPQRVESRITPGNLITMGSIIAVGLVAWGTLTADFRALAHRVEANDKRDDKTVDMLKIVEGSIIRIETEQQAVRREAERLGRQLDRIEILIRNGAPSTQPAAPSSRQ